MVRYGSFQLFLVFFLGSQAASIPSTLSLSLSLSFVRRWVIQCLILFCLFLSFSLPMPIWHAFCLPAIGQTRPFGVFASGDSAIHPFGNPSQPIPPIHAFGYPSIHASIRIAPFFIQFIHPNASQPSCCVHLFDPSERLMRNVPSIYPCPILRASIHRAVYVNHPPCWFVLLYPGNAALVYNHVKRDSDGKFFFFVLLRFIGSRKCLYA